MAGRALDGHGGGGVAGGRGAATAAEPRHPPRVRGLQPRARA